MGGTKSTHCMVEGRVLEALRVLSHGTRVTQAAYLREAIEDLLAKYSGASAPAVAEHRLHASIEPLQSIVFRITAAQKAALVELTCKTRVRQSEYLREAVVDLLVKYDCDPFKSDQQAGG